VRILGIDTALGACSVALLDGESVTVRAHEEMQRGHAEALAPMVDNAMRAAGASFSSLERIAVTTGPGTFTGQRVGLAFARALALALKIPVVGVTTLDAMALEVLERQSADAAIAVCDAKRGEVYLGGRDRAGETILAPALLAIEDAVKQVRGLAKTAQGKLVLAGTGAELVGAALAGELRLLGTLTQPDAVYVARLGALLDPAAAPPKPLYLRAPDAKLPSPPSR
jgi:tRNA threonylcarbamoyladenosine biosynthesis protein TsaB